MNIDAAETASDPNKENTSNADPPKPWYVYCLITEDRLATYVGATVDPDRRLRQHNNEIRGGAKATTSRAAAGRKWQRICTVTGFPDNHAALQFEWRWKSLARRKDCVGRPLERRLKSLQLLLAMDRPTSAAQPYSTYKYGHPEVFWDLQEAKELYSTLLGGDSSTPVSGL